MSARADRKAVVAGYASWFDRLDEDWLAKAPRAILDDLPLRLAYFRRRLKTDLSALKMLDLGAGSVGLLSEELARAGADVTVLDRHSRSLELARQHAERSGLNIQYRSGELGDLPFDDEAFDVVYGFGIFEHAGPQLDAWLAEVRRVLKPGGSLIYNMLNRTPAAWLLFKLIHVRILKFDPPGHHNFKWFVRPDEMRAALERAGLQHQDQTGVTSASPKPVALFKVLTRRGVAGDLQLGSDLSTVYQGHAIRVRTLKISRYGKSSK